MFASYITKTWYRDTYPCTHKFQVGDTPTPAEDAELDKAIFNACRVIDKVTFQRSTLFDDMTEDEQTCIKYAVGAQVDYIAGVGYNPNDMTSADYGGGFTVGKYSESAGSSDSRAQDVVSQDALEYLRPCNLTKNGFRGRPGTLRW